MGARVRFTTKNMEKELFNYYFYYYYLKKKKKQSVMI